MLDLDNVWFLEGRTSVEHNSDSEGSPHSTVFEKLEPKRVSKNHECGFDHLTYIEWQHGVFAGFLPENPDRDQQNADDKWRNHLCCLPLCSYASSEGEWNKNTCQHANQQNVADNIQMPE